MKYYYNKVTNEYAGTDEPVGDNFDFTYAAPPSTEHNASAMWNGESWDIIEAEIDTKNIVDNLKSQLQMKEQELLIANLRGKDISTILKDLDDLEKELAQYD